LSADLSAYIVRPLATPQKEAKMFPLSLALVVVVVNYGQIRLFRAGCDAAARVDGEMNAFTAVVALGAELEVTGQSPQRGAGKSFSRAARHADEEALLPVCALHLYGH